MQTLRDIAPYVALAAAALSLGPARPASSSCGASVRRLRRAQLVVMGHHEQRDIVAHVEQPRLAGAQPARGRRDPHRPARRAEAAPRPRPHQPRDRALRRLPRRRRRAERLVRAARQPPLRRRVQRHRGARLRAHLRQAPARRRRRPRPLAGGAAGRGGRRAAAAGAPARTARAPRGLPRLADEPRPPAGGAACRRRRAQGLRRAGGPRRPEPRRRGAARPPDAPRRNRCPTTSRSPGTPAADASGRARAASLEAPTRTGPHGRTDARRREWLTTASRVAFLGPEGTFTEEALLADPPAGALAPFPYPSIQDVMQAVAGGEAELGVVPIENSLEGSVTRTLDLLAFGFDDLTIVREVTHAIRHQLIARADLRLDEITKVVSIPIAYGQCRSFIQEHLADRRARGHRLHRRGRAPREPRGPAVGGHRHAALGRAVRVRGDPRRHRGLARQPHALRLPRAHPGAPGPGRPATRPASSAASAPTSRAACCSSSASSPTATSTSPRSSRGPPSRASATTSSSSTWRAAATTRPSSRRSSASPASCPG